MTSATPISAAAPPEPLGMAAVLRIPVMRRLWYAQIVSVFGDFVALFAVISILTFRLHGTLRQITGVQIAAMLPIAVLGIPALCAVLLVILIAAGKLFMEPKEPAAAAAMSQ